MEEKVKALLEKLYADRERIVREANLVLGVINEQISQLEAILGKDPGPPAPAGEEKAAEETKPPA